MSPNNSVLHPNMPSRSERPFGFNVIGHINASAGLGVIARNALRLISANGYPFAVYDVDLPHKIGAHELPYAINLNILSITALPYLILEWPQLLAHETLNVGFFWWELSTLPPVWIHSLEWYDVLVAGSTFIRSTFESNVPGTLAISATPAIQLPPGITSSREKFGIPRDVIAFICIVEPTSDPERKNPYAAIEAFRRSFEPNHPVRLVVKINTARKTLAPQSVSGKMRALRDECAADPRIQLIEQELSHADVLSLYAACDVFVSLHRSEGLGLGLMEAMALGKPVLATAWSGNTMYMNHINSCLVPYRLIPVNGSLHVYTRQFLQKKALWAEPDIDQAAAWMKRLADSPALRADIGKKAAEDMTQLQLQAERGQYIEELRLIWERRSAGPAGVRKKRDLRDLRAYEGSRFSFMPRIAMRNARKFLDRHVLWRLR